MHAEQPMRAPAANSSESAATPPCCAHCRPTFSQIVQELREVLKSTRQSLDLGMRPARA